MKKIALCIVASIAIYLITFMVSAEILLRTGTKVFLYCGFPIAVAVYFLLAGRVFENRFQLSRWKLWLFMNIAGYILCWIYLTVRNPMLWFNLGMVIFFVLPVTLALLVVWGLVGLGFLCVRLYRRNAAENERRRDFSKLKYILKLASVVIAVGALCTAGISANHYLRLEPAGAYVDGGTAAFYPTSSYPTQEEYQIKINKSWQTRYRTVYIVQYTGVDESSGTQLRYTENMGASKESAQHMVAENAAVQRRILWVDGTETYITIPAHQTAESYTNQFRMRYIALFSVSVLYLAAFGCFLIVKRRSGNRM